MKKREGRENTNLNSDSNRRKHIFAPTTGEHRTGVEKNERGVTDGEKRRNIVERGKKSQGGVLDGSPRPRLQSVLSYKRKKDDRMRDTVLNHHSTCLHH